MKKYIISIFVSLFFLAFSADADAYSAHSMILIEKSNLEVLISTNDSIRLPMASTTKIMTALVVLENSDPDMIVTVPDCAVGIEGSSMYLKFSEKITVRELLYGLMLTSGNDAANALACVVGGNVDRFVSMMNDKAISLGLKDTHFTNPSGLPDDNHYTTAYELALMTAAALDNPDFADIVSTKTYTTPNGRVLSNHNKLLHLYDGAVGVKTGYTKKAGRCLVGAATRNGITLICVTLNDGDDWSDHITAFDYGFANLKNITLAEKDGISLTLYTPDGLGVSIKNCSSLTSVVYNSQEISYSVFAPRFIYAPKSKGDIVGTVIFYADNKEICRDNLYITDSIDAPVKKDLLLTRVINIIKNLFKRKIQ